MPMQGAGEGTQLTAGLRFACAPEVSALAAAVTALAARHDLLRTRFARSGNLIEQARQLTLRWTLQLHRYPRMYVESSVRSLHDVPDNMMYLTTLAMQVLGSGGVSVQRKGVPAGEDVMAALKREAEILLDPAKEGGVLRATLLEPFANGASQPVLALTLHAVAGAEPSLALLQSQLLAAYARAQAGSRAAIKPGLQFRDVLYWLSQRQEQGAQTSFFHCTLGRIFFQMSYSLPRSALLINESARVV